MTPADDPIPPEILTRYYDAWGNLREVPPATIARLVAALAAANPKAGEPAGDAPTDRCFQPSWMERGERAWGIAVQLYGLRSPGNWGIGDFSDLRRLIREGGQRGADFIAVNPLHALFAADPGRYSPYSPSSREFINVLYIDVTAMRSMAGAPSAASRIAEASFQHRLVELRERDTVDYAGIAAIKNEAFRLAFQDFERHRQAHPDDPLGRDFAAFVAERGARLHQFALYQALSLQPGFGTDWTRWPEPYRDPSRAAAMESAAPQAEELRFHQFLQWEADWQLSRCAAAAREAGMRIGLYLDLALGTAPDSAEGWMGQASMIHGFYIGAPPDAWSEAGQNWGLFASHPASTASAGPGGFRDILAANMRHSGALRIDHVLGFHRLFLVPAEATAADGVYLHYPLARLCAVLAQESVARRCVIVGEDLGTIPEGLQEKLGACGLLTYRLFIFTTDNQGRYLSPQEYPRQALVAIATHDLPTFAGYWSGRDIELRTALGLYPDEAARQHAVAERQARRGAMLAALNAAGFGTNEEIGAVAAALHRFLARTQSALLLVQMEDLARERDQANLPGTVDIYPNWRRKLGRDLDAIFADPSTAELIAGIREERPRPTPS